MNGAQAADSSFSSDKLKKKYMKVILTFVLASCTALVGAAEPQGKIDFNVRDYGGSVAKAAEAAA